MNEFFTNNWFSIFTVVLVLGGTAVNYGMSKQRGIQTTAAVEELKQSWQHGTEKLEKYCKDEMDVLHGRISSATHEFDLHIGRSESHVTPMFLELLKTRHDFVSQQLLDTRTDIQRVEQQLRNT